MLLSLRKGQHASAQMAAVGAAEMVHDQWLACGRHLRSDSCGHFGRSFRVMSGPILQGSEDFGPEVLRSGEQVLLSATAQMFTDGVEIKALAIVWENPLYVKIFFNTYVTLINSERHQQTAGVAENRQDEPVKPFFTTTQETGSICMFRKVASLIH